jgi:hypothetical protein
MLFITRESSKKEYKEGNEGDLRLSTRERFSWSIRDTLVWDSHVTSFNHSSLSAISKHTETHATIRLSANYAVKLQHSNINIQQTKTIHYSFATSLIINKV